MIHAHEIHWSYPSLSLSWRNCKYNGTTAFWRLSSASPRWQCLVGLRQGSPNGAYVLNQHTIRSAIFFIARIQGSRHNDYIDLQVKIATWSLWNPPDSVSTARDGNNCCLGWLSLTTKRKVDYYSTVEVRKSMSGIHAIPLVYLLVLPCLVIKVNGRLQQSNSCGTTNGIVPSVLAR